MINHFELFHYDLSLTILKWLNTFWSVIVRILNIERLHRNRALVNLSFRLDCYVLHDEWRNGRIHWIHEFLHCLIESSRRWSGGYWSWYDVFWLQCIMKNKISTAEWFISMKVATSILWEIFTSTDNDLLWFSCENHVHSNKNFLTETSWHIKWIDAIYQK